MTFFRGIRRKAEISIGFHTALTARDKTFITRQKRTAREPNTGVPMKAEAWAIAKTATRNVRYLFMMNFSGLSLQQVKRDNDVGTRELMAAIVTDERR